MRASVAVAAIQRDLSESGLTTVPSFTEGWIGRTIRLIKSGVEADDSTQETDTEKLMEEGEADPPVDDAADGDLVQDKPFTLRFGNLLRSDAAVMSVRPTHSLILAQTLMLLHNYSQLAVIDEGGVFHGAVSWESIAKAHMAHASVSTVALARQTAPVAAHDELVLPRLDEISSRDYIFIRAGDGKIAGIITGADLTSRFGEIVKPFTMIEECERRLQRRVKAKVPADAIAIATNKRHKSADTLTFGSYRHCSRMRNTSCFSVGLLTIPLSLPR